MKIVNPSFEILFPTEEIAHLWSLRLIEESGRTCYKSEDRITDDSAPRFSRMLLDRGHEAMIEHAPDVHVRVICDRGVSHEIVRHRLMSYAQESTRYCNYSKGKHGGELTFIWPCFEWDDHRWKLWHESMDDAEAYYLELLEFGASPEEARSVLPNSLKTEIVMKANVREWRHFFKLRTSKAAHPQMRQIARPMLAEFRRLIPVVFDDVGVS